MKVRLQQDGFFQITVGVKVGELVATDAALFLSKKYEGGNQVRDGGRER